MDWSTLLARFHSGEWDKARFSIVLAVFFFVAALASVSLYAVTRSDLFDGTGASSVTQASSGGARNLASRPASQRWSSSDITASIFNYDQPWSRRFVTTQLDLGDPIVDWNDFANVYFGRLNGGERGIVRSNRYVLEDANALYHNLDLEKGWHPLYLYNQGVGSDSVVAFAEPENTKVAFDSGSRDLRTAAVSDGESVTEVIKDLEPVPLPAGIFLFAPALALLALFRRKR